jgi:hypothetical protein
MWGSYYCGGIGGIDQRALDRNSSGLIPCLLCRQIFPGYSSARRAPTKDGARAMMKVKRALKKRALEQSNSTEQNPWLNRGIDYVHSHKFKYFSFFAVRSQNESSSTVLIWINRWGVLVCNLWTWVDNWAVTAAVTRLARPAISKMLFICTTRINAYLHQPPGHAMMRYVNRIASIARCRHDIPGTTHHTDGAYHLHQLDEAYHWSHWTGEAHQGHHPCSLGQHPSYWRCWSLTPVRYTGIALHNTFSEW